MDATHFRRLMDLLGDALELPEAEREAWLDARTGDDRALITEVRSLLSQAPSAELEALTESLEDRVIRAARRIAGGPRAQPDRIGPFAIRTVLGEGGMGIVYGAHQEEPLRRDVALKVLHPGIHAPLVLARFESERRTLASLDHPFIARIYDAGTTNDALPWFSMEWVRGQPITKYCDERRMGLSERLELFRKVLDAVHYAHQKAIIHRDLKPSNVLVTEVDGQPIPKVIDFGIARVDARSGLTTAHTAFGAVMGTLEYMSPEQALSPASGVGTPADIYSLGVMLYELTTGRLPFAGDVLRTATPTELERLLLGTEPEVPSRLSPGLRGDLDTIIRMAMRKDPAQRYASVAQFSDDIRRHLEGRPVSARPATFGYLLRRFTARHRAAVLGSAAAVVLLVGVSGAFTVRLAAERDRGQLEAEKAVEVSDFLQRLFEISGPEESLGKVVTARELLDEGARSVRQGLSGQPEVQAAMMRVIGQAYHGLGMIEEARPLAETALELHRAHNGADHAEVATSQAFLASVMSDLGDLEDLEAAESLHRDALDIRRRLFGEAHPSVSASLYGLAEVLERKGDILGAESHYREALAQARRFHGPDAPQVAALEVSFGGMLRLNGQFDEAGPLLEGALAAQRQLYGSLHPRLGSAVRHMAALRREQGRYEEAASLYREALTIRRRVLGSDHPEVATTLSSYALLLQQMGDTEGAIAALTESIEILERIYPEPHPTMGPSYHNLAIQLANAGRRDEAVTWFQRAIRLNEEVLPPGHPNHAHSVLGLGWVHMDENRFAEAEVLFRDALQLRQRVLPPGHRDIGGALSDLGASLAAQRRYDAAEVALLEAHGILVESEGPAGRRASRAAGRLVDLYEARGRTEDAARFRM